MEILEASGSHATGSGSMGVSVVAEGVAPQFVRYINFVTPCYVEVVASPLRVSLNGCRG